MCNIIYRVSTHLRVESNLQTIGNIPKPNGEWLESCYITQNFLFSFCYLLHTVKQGEASIHFLYSSLTWTNLLISTTEGSQLLPILSMYPSQEFRLTQWWITVFHLFGGKKPMEMSSYLRKWSLKCVWLYALQPIIIVHFGYNLAQTFFRKIAKSSSLNSRLKLCQP